MERATKERLTGAVILVAVVAIAVPELLSGPGADTAASAAGEVAESGPPLTTYDLAVNPAVGPGASPQQELATAADTGKSAAIAQAVPPPVIERPQPVPVPATAAPARAGEVERAAKPSASARSPPAMSPTATAPATSAPATTTSRAGGEPVGKWWVQLGSFAAGENAERLARDLRGRGFVVDVSRVRAGGRELYRVRAGPEQDRDAATALRGRLAAIGQQGSLVGP